ncbi:MAG: hypothetical protein D6770_11125 [Anaerolineae bacterium]|nr:MAG: hypothetical protein D6770_11125 [Anaerolineae bacterium]
MKTLATPLLFALALVLTACRTAVPATGTSSLPDTAEPPETPTPSPPTPTPNYAWSNAETFEVELGQAFGLRADQTASIPSEGLAILHIVNIEFKCPSDPQVSCEVPLIATDYFQVSQGGKILDTQPWEEEMVFGDYMLKTIAHYEGYDYENHNFEIVLTVERRETINNTP